jgi:hypothetical protein
MRPVGTISDFGESRIAPLKARKLIALYLHVASCFPGSLAVVTAKAMGEETLVDDKQEDSLQVGREHQSSLQ